LRTGGENITLDNAASATISTEEDINMDEIARLALYDDSELERFLEEN
jgi:hypothetical protein